MSRPVLYVTLASALTLVACESVTRPAELSEPEVSATTTPTPAEVEALISGAYAQYWGVAHYWRSNAIGMGVMANHNSSSWGNFAMNDLGREPRQPVDDLNQTSYAWAYIFEVPWDDNYMAIQDASDGLDALKAGVELGPGGQDNARAEAFAKFAQGLSGCNLALNFREALLMDDRIPAQAAAKQPPVRHDVAMRFYMNKLDEAHRIA
ncbi:MAG: hypothetical protein R3266_14560, partial [Gemmatimonadota bacterium]|nr:hypothetical protein [Gemmatimonadota bacterium]